MTSIDARNTYQDLPPGWGKARVLDLVNLINGYAFKPSDWSKQGLPIIRIQNLNTPTATYNYYSNTLPNKFSVDTEDLLFAWSGTPGTSFGAHIWKGPKAWLNQHIFKVVFDENHLDKRFLRLAINQNLQEYIAAAHGGAGLAHITKGRFEGSELRIPPLAEQRRILAEVEKQFTRLDAAVEALRRARANLKRYRTSVLRAACAGRLVPTEAELARAEGRDYEPADLLLQRILKERRAKWEAEELSKMEAQERPPANDKWKSRYRQPLTPIAGALPRLAEGWMWVSVDSISTKVVDGVHKKPNYVSKGIPFVTVRNLTAGPGISFKKLNHITPDDHLDFVKRANPEKGDLLVSKDGTLGVIRVIRTDIEFSIFVSVALVKPVLRRMSSYLGVALSSPQVQVQMVPKGSGLQHIHLEDLRADCIPLPPVAEQQRIVAEVERRLSFIDEIEALVAANIKRAERLRQSILKRAFEGKLVLQDPNDEPASILLERIRAERKATREHAASREGANKTKRKRA